MNHNMFVVNEYTEVLDPNKKMLGPIADGSVLIARTAQGCWGPMLTPELKGGHEVTVPVAIENAMPGDALVVKIDDVKVLSSAGCSGTGKPLEGRFNGDPSIEAKCPSCGELNPPTELKGIGVDAIKCKLCGAAASPFEMTHGYTMILDDEFGITVSEQMSQNIASRSSIWSAIPKTARQHAATVLGPADLVGVLSRTRPFIGNIGTCPAIKFPASKNSIDLALPLIDKLAEFPLNADTVNALTDGHLDSDEVRAGAIMILPVMVEGAGLYFGDAHAMQGDGEIAGHTVDVSAEVKVRINVLKNLNLNGPILLPRYEDLPYLARPFTEAERERANALASHLKVELEDALPVQVIGTGAGINNALASGLERAANLFGMTVEEVKNRATITGSVEIARMTGVIQLTLLVPVATLKTLGLYEIIKEQYGPYLD